MIPLALLNDTIQCIVLEYRVAAAWHHAVQIDLRGGKRGGATFIQTIILCSAPPLQLRRMLPLLELNYPSELCVARLFQL